LAITILPSLEGTYAQAATIIPDETLPAERVTYPGAAGDMKALMLLVLKRMAITQR
jgi:hypothetical protein